MTGLLERLRQGWRAWKIKRQRSKLRSAYAKVGRIRYGLGPGFSPTLYALDRLTSEGLASITTDGDLIWHWPENDTAAKSGRDVCTDGGQDVTSKWTLVCTDCDWEDELVTDGHPADGPPSEVEDRVRKHKGTVDWSHVVRVEGCRADTDRDVDPSLLTDGGQCLSGISRPTPKSIYGDDDAPEKCERCGKRFVTFRYVNGEEVCGCCYADKMGYLAEEHPRIGRIEETDTDHSGGDQDV